MNKYERRLTERVTGRQPNWFLRNWEYQDIEDENEKNRRTFVYTGEYYKMPITPQKRKARKLLAAGLFIILCVMYVLFEVTRTQGGFVWYAGAPCLLAVIPIFYLGLGVFNFAAAEEYFTYRRMYAAYTRIRIGGKFTAALLGIGTIGQLVFVLQYGRALQIGPELIMLFGALICAGIAAGIVMLAKHTPSEEVSRKEYPGEKRKT